MGWGVCGWGVGGVAARLLAALTGGMQRPSSRSMVHLTFCAARKSSAATSSACSRRSSATAASTLGGLGGGLSSSAAVLVAAAGEAEWARWRWRRRRRGVARMVAGRQCSALTGGCGCVGGAATAGSVWDGSVSEKKTLVLSIVALARELNWPLRAAPRQPAACRAPPAAAARPRSAPEPPAAAAGTRALAC